MTRAARPLIGYARRCSQPSPPGRVGQRSPSSESLAGLAFCDLYAGSGAVGLEAASRGATRVLLVERDPRTAQLARRNAEALRLAVDVVVSSVEQVLESLQLTLST